jgi:hypothetical protein
VIRVCLYKVRRNGSIVDGAISVFSGFGKYYHAELLFSDGLSFTSTQMDPGINAVDGCRFKRIDYNKHPERWDIIDIPADAIEEDRVRNFCRRQLGCRYDYAGCVRFAIPFWTEHKDKWFCSEVVTAALQQLFSAGYESDAAHAVRRLRGVKPWRVSPNHLANLLRV